MVQEYSETEIGQQKAELRREFVWCAPVLNAGDSALASGLRSGQ